MKRPVALALTTCALLTGCGPEKHLALDLRAVSITVPRILTPAITLVPPALTPAPVALPPVPPLATFLPPVVDVTQPAPPAVVVDPPQPPVACPRAGQFDTPEKPASPAVAGYPANAEYVENALGTYAVNGIVKPLDGIVDAKVTRLPSSTTSTGQLVDSWSVTRRSGKGSSVEVYQLVHASATASATAPGVYLVGLAWDDPTRGKLTFQPTANGVQILPDPVAVATNDTQYAGAATDPDTLTTLELNRNVRARTRIDACGKLIDTYTVEMTGTLVSPSRTYQIVWTQNLATAYGALDVASTFSLTSAVDSLRWTRTLRTTRVPVASR